VTENGDPTADRVAAEGGVSRSPEDGLDTEAAPPTRPAEGDEAAPPTLDEQLAERTADLQRLQAEYQNYRKRVDRDRAHARTAGEANVLRSLLTVLDDLGRAEQHGELTGGFKAVADALQQAVKAHRLESFGAPGEAFDPRLHEALFHAGESADIDVTTIASVVRTGYRVGDEVIRHAQVGVEDPQERNATSQPADAQSVSTEPPAGEAGEKAGKAGEKAGEASQEADE
jgi:molecular chaperone GrpE